jgi:hypothetical protein
VGFPGGKIECGETIKAAVSVLFNNDEDASS